MTGVQTCALPILIERRFKGMTETPFNLQLFDFERDRLITTIDKKLSDTQKKMILSVAKGEPEWLYEDWSIFPGIAWKLKNIEIIKKDNPLKFKTQINDLERILT